jgi:2-polyprenyl-3-methyl-5-hydroxy-6-metoxy-1,4-benzoquinol methylase
MRTLFHATDRLYRTTDKSFLVVECNRCKMLRLYPKPSPEELGTYYPKNYWHSDEGGRITSMEETYRRFVSQDHIRFLERAIGDAGGTGLVMDVGCGGGLLLRMLRERGHKVLGMDFSVDAASIAWGQNGVPAICAPLTQAPLRAGSCSVLSMFHVLEHLYEPHEYLLAARELLRDDGRLVVQVPNAASWQFLIFGENWNGIDVPRHLWNFRLGDLNVLLDRCGFVPVRTKHFSLRDNPAGFSISLAPELDPMARRVRKIEETPFQRLVKNGAHLALMGLALPFSLLEAMCRAGSTVMVEAKKKA